MTLICLLPFINKAFHIDDTVYLYVAQQIHEHPLDFYGFRLNSLGTISWMYEINKNPPGHSYYLAFAALFLGWSEISMHLAMLVPSVCAGVGMYRLAERFCSRPLLATAIGVLTPGFLVSNSNIMCEPMMLAFYVWAIVMWVRGMDSNSPRQLALAAALIGIGTLTKYIVVTALPLLIAYTILRDKKITRTLFYFLIPSAILIAYDAVTYTLYDRSLLLDIVGFSTSYSTQSIRQSALNKLIIGLAFTGGCYLSAFFFLPFHFGRRGIRLYALAAILLLGLMITIGGFDSAYTMYEGSKIRWGFVFQTVVFVTAGIHLLVLPILDVMRNRDPDSMLLLLLIFGILTFSVMINWTTNGRSLLPMVPAVGILVVRQMDAKQRDRSSHLRFAIPLALSALLAFLVTIGDYQLAGTMRTAARSYDAFHKNPDGKNWFEGYWGYQYYMERAGYEHLDLDILNSSKAFSQLKLTDIGVATNDSITMFRTHQSFTIPGSYVESLQEFPIRQVAYISTMKSLSGAGFYNSNQGMLPYYFGKADGESYLVYKIR